MGGDLVVRMYGKHCSFLKYAHKIAGQEAEDIVQEAYLRLAKMNGRLVDKGLFSYTCKIISNISVDNWRRKTRSVETVPVYEDSACDEQSASPLELSDALERAMESLEPRYRNVVALASEGFRYKEIAEIERIPLGTVMSRLHRAREQLREKIKHYSIEPPVVS